ncbi:hypothetical protein AD945_04280 [Gluconobacter albidus]|uniref:Uncharacterized protein n=1 Tax=Gluconobacter albidus TaxID=318683 RepID=A0A149TL78_9PROT|nr:hypothetical protein AD945_04280 [Gluconobacter albidus]
MTDLFEFNDIEQTDIFKEVCVLLLKMEPFTELDIYELKVLVKNLLLGFEPNRYGDPEWDQIISSDVLWDCLTPEQQKQYRVECSRYEALEEEDFSVILNRLRYDKQFKKHFRIEMARTGGRRYRVSYPSKIVRLGT